MRIKITAACFPGFYGSRFSELFVEENALYQLEHEFADLKHLDDWGLAEDYRDRVAKEFAEKYIVELNTGLGLKMKLVSQYVKSPLEYNFTTDILMCEVEIEDWEAFVKKITTLMDEPEYRTQLAGIIRNRHTSCSGFISFMSNEIEDWYGLIQDPENVNYISCVLWYLYCLKTGEDIDGNGNWGICDQVYDYISSNTDIMNAVPLTPEAKREYEEVLNTIQYDL